MLAIQANAQSDITGIILDKTTDKPIKKVTVRNIHQNSELLTDANGAFKISVRNGELVDFSSPYYQTVRLRIINKKQPARYFIHLEKQGNISNVKGKQLNYKLDSLTNDKAYFTAMNGARDGENNTCPGNSTNTKRKHWAFPAVFKKGQSEKYIDFVFTEKLVSKITNLVGEDLRRFMQNYRPTEGFLRSATEYEYLESIKKSYRDFSLKENY